MGSMTENMEKATLVFDKGYNCAQSMLYVYGKECFKNEELALKLASGFGGGICSRGKTCGAVTGALMVLGLHFGYSSFDNPAEKERVSRVTNEFLDEFEKRFEGLNCKQLLGVDISNTEGRDYAMQNNVFERICPGIIDGASEILEDLVGKY